MVSLHELCNITERGVKFKSPYDDTEIMIGPEESMKI